MADQPATISELQGSIETIISKRAMQASRMPYDRKVWVNAVSVARSTFNRVPTGATVEVYHQAVVKALEALSCTYSDPEGEYTNGRGAIGDILYDVIGLRSSAE